jgi:hypothetical protein
MDVAAGMRCGVGRELARESRCGGVVIWEGKEKL